MVEMTAIYSLSVESIEGSEGSRSYRDQKKDLVERKTGKQWLVTESQYYRRRYRIPKVTMTRVR